ncbi:MAG: hypothetical protein QM541_00175 [Flavobacterium sp.]|nr:hypothetical protein [Flavobacterium sp.]
MISQFFSNPFAHITVGSGKFYKFVDAHLQSLKANNEGGKFDVLITKLTALLAPYKAWLSTQDKSTIDRENDTDSVNALLDKFEDFIDSLFKEVNYVFADNDSVKHEVFPHGKSEYNNITIINAPVLLQRVADFCAAHKTDLKAGRDTISLQFLTDFKTERSEQLGSKSSVSTGSSDGKTLRNAIAVYLYEVLLHLLLAHVDNTKVVEQYYDFSIVHIRRKAKEDGA